jgi:hypothetical protein
VTVVRPAVLEERSASIIRVARIGELRTTLPVTSNRGTLRRATRRYIPEDGILRIALCSLRNITFCFPDYLFNFFSAFFFVFPDVLRMIGRIPNNLPAT